jgi:hypothetical protein
MQFKETATGHHGHFFFKCRLCDDNVNNLANVFLRLAFSGMELGQRKSDLLLSAPPPLEWAGRLKTKHPEHFGRSGLWQILTLSQEADRAPDKAIEVKRRIAQRHDFHVMPDD